MQWLNKRALPFTDMWDVCIEAKNVAYYRTSVARFKHKFATFNFYYHSLSLVVCLVLFIVSTLILKLVN